VALAVVAQGGKPPKKVKKVTERLETWEAGKIGPTFWQVGSNSVCGNLGKCCQGRVQMKRNPYIEDVAFQMESLLRNIAIDFIGPLSSNQIMLLTYY
jgi:hypothetical protein